MRSSRAAVASLVCDRRRWARRGGGFSIIEVIIAMLLVAAVFTAAGTLFRDTTRVHLDVQLTGAAEQLASSVLAAASAGNCGAESLLDASGVSPVVTSDVAAPSWAPSVAQIDQSCADVLLPPEWCQGESYSLCTSQLAAGGNADAPPTTPVAVGQGDPAPTGAPAPAGSGPGATSGAGWVTMIGKTTATVYVRSWFVATSDLGASSGEDPCTTANAATVAVPPMGIVHQVTVDYRGGSVRQQVFDSLPSSPAYTGADYSGLVVHVPPPASLSSEDYVVVGVNSANLAPVGRFVSPSGCAWFPLLPGGQLSSAGVTVTVYSSTGVQLAAFPITNAKIDGGAPAGVFSPSGGCVILTTQSGSTAPAAPCTVPIWGQS